MSSYIPAREDQLRAILPKNYKYYIHRVSVKESGTIPTEVKLEAHFRVNVSDEESFQVSVSVVAYLTTKHTNRIDQD